MDGIDFDFCQRQYGFSREQCLSWFAEDVLSDYRTPNPLFDPISYLLTNNDVATAHLHPVRHFLKHGFKEGRTFRRPTRYRSYETSSLSAAVAGEPRVAIVLHIFYAQYIMDFVEKVKGLLYSSVKVLYPRLRKFLKSASQLLNRRSPSKGLSVRSLQIVGAIFPL